jgi:hypothetical protein
MVSLATDFVCIPSDRRYESLEARNSKSRVLPRTKSIDAFRSFGCRTQPRHWFGHSNVEARIPQVEGPWLERINVHDVPPTRSCKNVI